MTRNIVDDSFAKAHRHPTVERPFAKAELKKEFSDSAREAAAEARSKQHGSAEYHDAKVGEHQIKAQEHYSAAGKAGRVGDEEGKQLHNEAAMEHERAANGHEEHAYSIRDQESGGAGEGTSTEGADEGSRTAEIASARAWAHKR